MFTHPCFIRKNTPELRKYLKNLGYTVGTDDYTKATIEVLGIVFIILKLCKIIDWSWWLITSPFWQFNLNYNNDTYILCILYH